MLGFTSISETPISVANALVVVSKVHSTNLLKYLYLSLTQTVNSNLIAAIPKTQATNTLNRRSSNISQSTFSHSQLESLITHLSDSELKASPASSFQTDSVAKADIFKINNASGLKRDSYLTANSNDSIKKANIFKINSTSGLKRDSYLIASSNNSLFRLSSSYIHSVNFLSIKESQRQSKLEGLLKAASALIYSTDVLNRLASETIFSTETLVRKIGEAAHGIDVSAIGRNLLLSSADVLLKSSNNYQHYLKALVIAGGLSSQYVASRLKSISVAAQAIDSLKYEVFSQNQSAAADIKAGFFDFQSIDINLIKDTSYIMKSDMLRLIIRQVISSVSSNKISDFRVSFNTSAFIRDNFIVSFSLISFLKKAQTRTSSIDTLKIALKSASHQVVINRIGGGDRSSFSTSELYVSQSNAQDTGAGLIRESIKQYGTVLFKKKSISESQESNSLLFLIGEINTSLVAFVKGQYNQSQSASGKRIAGFIRIITADTNTKGTTSNSHESDSLRMSSTLISYGSLTFKKYAYTKRHSSYANKIDSTNPKMKAVARLFGNYNRFSGNSSNLKKDSSLTVGTSCYRVYEEPAGYFEESVFGDSYWVVASG